MKNIHKVKVHTMIFDHQLRPHVSKALYPILRDFCTVLGEPRGRLGDPVSWPVWTVAAWCEYLQDYFDECKSRECPPPPKMLAEVKALRQYLLNSNIRYIIIND